MSLNLKFNIQLEVSADEAPGDLEYRIEKAVRSEAHAIFPEAEISTSATIAEDATPAKRTRRKS